jgi:iron complex transport system substrate-binding protein
MRIASLVPHATELLFALGLGPQVVGVTHECDYPLEALELPRVTRDVLPSGLSAGEIDAAVREHTLNNEAIYELDDDALRALEPDLIVTQALCPVCAVSHDEVLALARTMKGPPKVIALDPHTFGESLGDIRTLAQATGSRDAGVELVARIAGRTDRVRLAIRGARRPTVTAIEWLDPVYIAGHWTPQLIEMAGGEDILGMPGQHSETMGWEIVAAAEPEIAVVMPCGYDAPRAAQEAVAFAEPLAALGARRVVAVNASAYFSRPGPRLVEGIELLAKILHPTLTGGIPGPADAWIEIEALSLAEPASSGEA